MAKAAYPTIGIAALVMFGIVYFIGCLPLSDVYRLSASYAKKTPEARMPRESYFNRIGLYKII